MVETFKAWKKLIWEGSRPVGPAGQAKSMGDRAPTLASVGTLLDSICCLRVKTGASEKMKAIFSLRSGSKTFNSGIFPPCSASRCLNSSSWMP